MKQICVITGTRADYGLLYWLMRDIDQSASLDLKVMATGMHLSKQHGYTADVIEADGFKIHAKIDMQLGDDGPADITRSMAVGLTGFAEQFDEYKPDMVVVLGDRFEAFIAATAAMMARIPIAHMHGGEVTEGALDEPMRHAISKMSYLHFVAAEDYRRRVIQLGEAPERVHTVGALGLDNIAKLDLLSRGALEQEMDFQFGDKNLIVTFHPATMEGGTSGEQVDQLLSAFDQFPDIHLIFTMPNADADSRIIGDKINLFCDRRDNAKAFISLGQLRYLSCLSHVDGMVGNSSSGLIEAPTFGIGTVNIGDRQRGRLRGDTVIDCMPQSAAIAKAIRRLYEPSFVDLLNDADNPYGKAGAADKIMAVLEAHDFAAGTQKQFYDQP